MKRWITVLILLTLVLVSCSEGNDATNNSGDNKEANEDEKKQKLWQEVNSLNTIVSFMNTGAHPDDENSGLLAYMSLGEGVDSSSVLAHRGEGGQNEIGTEAGEGAGVNRTRDLEESAKMILNHADLLNTVFDNSITDFGFSKSPEETLEEEGKEKTYEGFLKVIRQQRPDILFTSVRDVENQHGHHR